MIKFFYVLNEKYCQYLSTNSFQDFTSYLTETVFSSINLAKNWLTSSYEQTPNNKYFVNTFFRDDNISKNDGAIVELGIVSGNSRPNKNKKRWNN